MEFDISAYSHIGNRENNEDSLGTLSGEHFRVAVVADGVGGHQRGEVASQEAVRYILNAVDGGPEGTNLVETIAGASRSVSEIAGGYTTVAALWLSDDQALAAHVGDSRVYQFRDGTVLYQSLDHSDVMMAVLMGELPPEAPRTHPNRNRIFRALGLPGEDIKVDSQRLDIRPGDRFLLCSDGFWEPVWEKDMLRTMARTETAEDWLSQMRAIVDQARDPAQDNHTAIAIIAK